VLNDQPIAATIADSLEQQTGRPIAYETVPICLAG
jgi:hypothetical protein